MIRTTYIFLVLSLILSTTVSAQTSHKLLREGNSSYEKGDYAIAEDLYRKSNQKDNNLKSNYNLGNATYQQERYEEAIDHYISATSKAASPEAESNAYYNLGNAYYQNQDLEEAIKAYKQAINLNSNNEKAQYNLSMAKLMKMQMQQQQQEQEQDQSSDQNEDSEDQEKQDQEGNDSQEKGDNQEQNENEEQEESEEEQDPSDEQDIEETTFDSTRLEKQSLDSIDAAKLLQIIQSEEQKVQEKLRKFNSSKKKHDKDW